MESVHPNLALVNQFFQAYLANNHSAIEEILSPAIKWHIPGEHPLSGTKNGVRAVVEYLKKLEQFSFKAAPIVIGVNDHFVIDCHRNWSNLPSDNLNNMSCLLWKIENGQIIEVFNFPENQIIVDAFFNKTAKI
jgi:ketosteroid isomerase-like protein